MENHCTVGIVVVESEAWPLRRRAQPVATWEHPCAGFWRARWANTDLIVARTSPGKVNAALAAQALLQRTPVDLLMSVGTAGALGDLQTGDVVIATEVLWHDTGLYLDNRFVHFGGFVYEPSRGRAVRDSYRLPAPLEEATRAWAERRSAADQARIRVHWGRVLTGDQVILSTQRKQYLRKRFGALAVEMESAAVAQVAESWGVPWLVVRAASDQANSEMGFDFTPLAQWSTAGRNLLARTRAAIRLVRVWAADPAWRRKLRQARSGLKAASASATEVAFALVASPNLRRSLAEAGGNPAHRQRRPAGT